MCLPVAEDQHQNPALTVEVPATATVGQVKAKIEELYGIASHAQRLQHTPEPSDECFADRVSVAWASRLGSLYLLPAEQSNHSYDSDQSDEEVEVLPQEDGRVKVLQDAQPALQEIVQSLEGITYHVHVMLPVLVGGSVDKQMMTLEADAMCLVRDLLAAAKAEFFGERADCYPAILVSDEGRELPLDLPLHFVGVRDGETIILSHSRIPSCDSYGEDEDSDPFDCYMQHWAAYP